MKKKLLTLFTIASIFMVAGCGTKVKLKNGEEVIASLTDKEFTAEELFDKLKEKYGSSVLLDMIDSYIIDTEIPDDSSYEEEAKAQLSSMKSYYEQYSYDWDDVLSYYGFSNDKEFLQSTIESAKKTDIVKNFLKEKVTDDEIQKYYDEEIYGDYTVKHILISTSTDDDTTEEEAKEAALTKAKEVIEKLNNGESWSDLVTEYSDDDNTKDDDGLLPAFTNGDYQDSFFKATLELKDSEYTQEPVESTYGYHIIYRVSATEKPSLEDSKDTCLDKIVTNKLANDDNLETQTWLDIREKYELNIADSTIEKAYKKSLTTEEESD
jgi:osmotically-inducible protein OsmY